MEILKHLLGLCGESHPNIFTFILLFVCVLTLFRYRKLYLK
mgnify:CR=1 FL=1